MQFITKKDVDALFKEDMSNETKQHTPTPWFQSHREGQDGGYRTEIYDTTGETIAILTWYAMPKNKDGSFGTYREANAKRIIACVNAMEGVKDPKKFVKDAKRREKFLETILGEIQMVYNPKEIDFHTAIESIKYLIEKELGL